MIKLKHLIIILVLIIIPMGLWQASLLLEPPKETIYMNEELGFKTLLPAGWELKLRRPSLVFMKEEFCGISVWVKENETSLEDYLRLVPEYENTIYEGPAKLGGENAWEMVVLYEVKATIRIDERQYTVNYNKERMIFAFHKGRIYKVYFTVSGEKIDNLEPLFTKLTPDFEKFVHAFEFI